MPAGEPHWRKSLPADLAAVAEVIGELILEAMAAGE